MQYLVAAVCTSRIPGAAAPGLAEATSDSGANGDACAAWGQPPDNKPGLDPPLPEDLGAARPHHDRLK